jgi:hypothetical protein
MLPRAAQDDEYGHGCLNEMQDAWRIASMSHVKSIGNDIYKIFLALDAAVSEYLVQPTTQSPPPP